MASEQPIYSKKVLFEKAMKGEWEGVKEIYTNYGEAHKEKITRLGHTALHLAIGDGKVKVVQELVDLIKKRSSSSRDGKGESARDVLAIGNEKGHTALHFAAFVGSVKMCECIARVDQSLVGVRNNAGETPLFGAVLYGHKEAFLCLHSIICPDGITSKAAYSYCRKEGQGENILHCAIFEEVFDLALQILALYGGLVDQVDEKGSSPLDTLATKPSCFESGSNLRGWNKIVYAWTDVSISPADADGLQRRTTEDPENPGEYARTGNRFLPENYAICFEFLKLAYKAMLVIFGYAEHTHMIRQKKEKHVLACLVLDKLLERVKMYDNIDRQTGANPGTTNQNGHDDDFIVNPELELENDKKEKEETDKRTSTEMKHWTQTAIIIAAENGIAEIVERILEKYPVAIHDVDSNMRNILLLAAKNRHLKVYKLLKKSKKNSRDIVLRTVDKDRNCALHFAAMVDENNLKPWPIPGAALQMQWEIKWYKFVEKSMPPHFFLRANNKGETPQQIFTKNHKALVKAGGEWLTSTSTSCSVVATLIATVAFASSTTFPGGTDNLSGKPTLENHPSFDLFAISSLFALCFSVTALVMFLAILTSRHEEKDFGKDLPRKLLLGLTSLFISIAATITSFCAGHFLVLEDKFKFVAFPVYGVMFLPVCLFAAAQLPLYLDLIKATFRSPF